MASLPPLPAFCTVVGTHGVREATGTQVVTVRGTTVRLVDGRPRRVLTEKRRRVLRYGWVAVPDCVSQDYAGPASFPTYDNSSPFDGYGPLGDCEVAAMADLIQLRTGVTYTAASLEQAYLEMSPQNAGLSDVQLFGWWSSWDNGQQLLGETAVGTDPASIAQAVEATGQILVDVQTPGSFTATMENGVPVAFGPSPGGTHTLVVTGLTPTGPVVVTWGVALAVSWATFESWAPFAAWEVTLG